MLIFQLKLFLKLMDQLFFSYNNITNCFQKKIGPEF